MESATMLTLRDELECPYASCIRLVQLLKDNIDSFKDLELLRILVCHPHCASMVISIVIDQLLFEYGVVDILLGYACLSNHHLEMIAYDIFRGMDAPGGKAWKGAKLVILQCFDQASAVSKARIKSQILDEIARKEREYRG